MSKHKPDEKILVLLKRKFPRIGFEGGLYFEICGDACALVKELKAKVTKHSVSKKKDGKVKLKRLSRRDKVLRDTIRKQESVAIAFAAMCLEACIWDYAACRTSQNKTKENFGSLNLVAKWVVIPQLLCGSDITAKRINGTCPLGILRALKDERNNLVHPKSKPLPDNSKDALKAIRNQKRKIKAEEAFNLIGALLRELEKVDKSDWWFFQTPLYQDSIKES